MTLVDCNRKQRAADVSKALNVVKLLKLVSCRMLLPEVGLYIE
ncbi:hypothetical protein GQ55_4G246900 [Panicum hallii var. hallii]|uniref:Uncharacterized protein n=1 Tax=Panicum hallii var. hallii TaxID=1504633 RepID=A0A2T7DZU2_9POAL|nr:hypothetical protein GQ55_4G246900 [Panicum hallii var. hallii]